MKELPDVPSELCVPITPLIVQPDSLRAAIIGSLGCPQTQTTFVRIGGQNTDVLAQGQLACAFYVSTHLHTFGFVPEPQLNVQRLMQVLCAHGWQQTEELCDTCVVVWEAAASKRTGLTHFHIGFCLRRKNGSHMFVSYSDDPPYPIVHGEQYKGRDIEWIFTHDTLTPQV